MPAWLGEIEPLLPGDRISTRRADREAASRDESTIPAALPDAVVWPLTTEEVAEVVKVAFRNDVPLTARGAGSSLEGNSIPLHGGLVVDLSRMTEVVHLATADLLVRVQPGLVYSQLNQALRTHGLFFPPHPGGSADIATIGGMTATNASGIYSVRYGATRDYVRAATVVTGSGEVVRLGSSCPKVSSGYHLIGLLVGSEGTLGIATEITLALAPLPQARRRLAFAFPSETRAAAAIAEMMRYGVALAAVEFLDRHCVRAVNRFSSSQVVEQPLILLEIHGIEPILAQQEEAARTLCAEHGGNAVGERGEDAWALRHQVTRAIQALRPQSRIVRTDLAFPVSSLPTVVQRSHELAAKRRVLLHTFGHAGLGILHALILADPVEDSEWGNASALKDELVDLALGVGGAVSGEHGIGLGNRKYSAREHGNALPLMRAIKQVFDPKGILNPGKIWES